MKKFFLILVMAVLALASAFLLIGGFTEENLNSVSDYKEVSGIILGEEEISVELALTNEERKRGLSGRETLLSGTGMLFVFPEEGRHGIWMPDMNFPIDIFWIKRELENNLPKYFIIDLKKDVQPESFPEIFFPQEPADFVLETNAGFAEENEIEIGQEVIFY